MSKQIEFANFICRFGDEKVLLDLAEEVVIPAFLINRLRDYGDTSYFFYQTQIIELQKGDSPVIGIVGRFIKDTLLEREQVFDKQTGLVRDHQSIRSAPSSVFLLILNNHKLIYLHETANAPNLAAFRATAEKFIRMSHKEFINKTYDEKKGGEAAVTKKALQETFPYPRIDIIPLSSDASFEEFVRQYDVLRSVQIRFVQTNSELDMNEFFSQVREQMDSMGARRTTLMHNNSQGLSRETAIKQFAPLAREGNAQIDLEGKDSQGDILRGNNDNFKVRVSIGEVKEKLPDAASEMYKTFVKLVRAGTIRIAKSGHAAADKIKNLSKRYR